MPNPLDYLKKAGSWAVNPLVSKETIAPMQDALDAPALERSCNDLVASVGRT